MYKVATNGTKTTLLSDAFHMGGATLTPPSSAFGGRLYIVENYWPSRPTDIYAVSPDGTYELFGQGFDNWDENDVVYGPDGALYVCDRNPGIIYQITPEPGTLGLMLAGGLVLLRRKAK